MRQHDERIVSTAAVDGGLRPVEVDDIIACAASDDVSAATAVNRVTAATGEDAIRPGGSDYGNARRKRRSVDVFKVCDKRLRIYSLIGRRQVDVVCRQQDKRVVARPTVNRRFCAMKADNVVASTSLDDVCAAAAINRIIAGPTRNDIDAGCSDQIIVAGSRANHIGDADEFIPIGQSADTDTCGQVDRYSGG